VCQHAVLLGSSVLVLHANMALRTHDGICYAAVDIFFNNMSILLLLVLLLLLFVKNDNGTSD